MTHSFLLVNEKRFVNGCDINLDKVMDVLYFAQAIAVNLIASFVLAQ